MKRKTNKNSIFNSTNIKTLRKEVNEEMCKTLTTLPTKPYCKTSKHL